MEVRAYRSSVKLSLLDLPLRPEQLADLFPPHLREHAERLRRERPPDETTANATVRLDNKIRLLMVAAGDRTSPGISITGDADALPTLLGVLDAPDPKFNIVTP